MRAGELIVFEGLDGAGKTTLSRAVAARIGAEWRATPDASLREVRATIDAAMIDDPVALQLFYAATVRWASTRAREVIARGQPMVIDRYWASTVVYAPLRGSAIELGVVQATLCPPSLTVFVDVGDELRRARVAARGETNADRASLRQGAALREAYRQVLAEPFHGRVLRVENDGDLEASVTAVLSALSAPEAA